MASSAVSGSPDAAVAVKRKYSEPTFDYTTCGDCFWYREKLDTSVVEFLREQYGDFQCKYPIACLDSEGKRLEMDPRRVYFSVCCHSPMCHLCISAMCAHSTSTKCLNCQKGDVKYNAPEDHMSKIALKLYEKRCPGCHLVVYTKSRFDKHVKECPCLWTKCPLCLQQITARDFYEHVGRKHAPKSLLKKPLDVFTREESDGNTTEEILVSGNESQ